MKSNTDDLKSNLRRALVSAPDDFSLREVRSVIVRALEMVEEVERRRVKRSDAAESRAARNIFIPRPQSSFNAIERELETERAKLEEIKSRRSSGRDARSSEGEELQNVFG